MCFCLSGDCYGYFLFVEYCEKPRRRRRLRSPHFVGGAEAGCTSGRVKLNDCSWIPNNIAEAVCLEDFSSSPLSSGFNFLRKIKGN